jgi:hypothetical protein
MDDMTSRKPPPNSNDPSRRIVVASDLEALGSRLYEFETAITGQLAELKTLIQTESVRCPYREAINQGTVNGRRLDDLEDLVTNVRIDRAKERRTGAGIGGSVVAMIASIAFALGRSAGWW